MDFNDFRKQRYQGSSRHHAVPKGGCPTIIAFQQVLERGFRTSINIPMRKVTIPDHTIGGGGSEDMVSSIRCRMVSQKDSEDILMS